jgi:hypothetical protein
MCVANKWNEKVHHVGFTILILLIFLSSLPEMRGMDKIICGPTSCWISKKFCTCGPDRKLSYEFGDALAG